LTWIADNNYNVFENYSSNKWIEKLDGANTFEFEQVELNSDQNGIILYDPSRKVFVELNEHDSKYGDEKNELRPLYIGRWLNEDFVDRLKLNINDYNAQGNNELLLNDAISIGSNTDTNQNFITDEIPQSIRKFHYI
jgi:hypothetical protein